MFSDSVLAFALVVLSTAAGIFGLYILPVAGVSLLIVACIGGLRVLLSYVRSPVGQHKDAGEGALTVAMLSTRKEVRQLPKAPDEASSAQMALFTVNVIGGYGTPTTATAETQASRARLSGSLPRPKSRPAN